MKAKAQQMRIVGLDLVRATAAFAVAIPHFISLAFQDSTLNEQVAIVSVEVFFVLSGFVLAPQLVFVMSAGTFRPRLERLKIFLYRRWMRTLPPYLCALLIMAILTGNLFSGEFFRLLFFSQNLFGISKTNEFFVPAWSLSVEEWFYIIFPVFLLAARHFSLLPPKAAFVFLAIFAAVKLIGLFLVADFSLVGRRLVIFRLDAICFGFLLHLFVDWIEKRAPKFLPPLAMVALVVSASLLALLLHAIENSTAESYRLAFMYLAPLFAASVLLCALAAEPALKRSKLLIQLSKRGGAISYDVYLFHSPLLLLMSRFFVNWSFEARLAVYLAILVPFCLWFYSFFESPILRARPGYGEEMKE